MDEKATPKDIPAKKIDVQPEKKPFVRREHLTHRPFHNSALITLRDGMGTNYSVKKK